MLNVSEHCILRIPVTDIIWEKWTVRLGMITAGDTRLTQRNGETVTRLAGMEMDVEYHDNVNDDNYV